MMLAAKRIVLGPSASYTREMSGWTKAQPYEAPLRHIMPVRHRERSVAISLYLSHHPEPDLQDLQELQRFLMVHIGAE